MSRGRDWTGLTFQVAAAILAPLNAWAYRESGDIVSLGVVVLLLGSMFFAAWVDRRIGRLRR